MPENKQENEMPFLEHLEELRWKLVYSISCLVIGMIICFIFSEKILEVLQYPSQRLDPPLEFQFLKVQGMFLVKLEIGFFGGLALALPFIIHQIWNFIAPGLLKKEKKYFLPLVFFSTILFTIGLSFAYYIIIPLALDFFIGLSVEGIEPQITINYYISFVIQLMFVFGAFFELPLLSYFLAKTGLLTAEFMGKYRRHAIIIIFLLAAFFTPPDPISQIFLGMPLLLLYEISIYIVKFVDRGRNKRQLKKVEENPSMQNAK